MENSALNKNPLMLIALLSGALIISALILQYGFNVIPCKMCWWQRYAHFAIFAASLFGLSQPTHARNATYLVMLSALGGLGVALWQFAAQHQWLPYPPTCTSDAAQALAGAADLIAAMNNQPPLVPCDKETFLFLGISLAGWNIPAMAAVLALAIPTIRK